MLNVLLAVLVFPAASVKPPAPTDIDAVPDAFADGVNVAEYGPEPDNADNEPPETDTSPTTKSDVGSDNVNVTDVVSPAFNVPEPERTTVNTDGEVVSTTIAFAPAMLFEPDGTVVEVIALPAASATVPTTKLDTVKSDDV